MDLGKRLQHARTAMGLTLNDVEAKSKLGSSSLSDFENDKREPRLPQLKILADLYRRPLTFFLDDGPLAAEVVLWRQRPTSPQVEELQADLLNLASQYNRLEQLCDDLMECDLPNAAGDKERFGYRDAEKLAHDFRNKYALGDRPGQSLLRVLEEVCKVKVFHISFQPTGSAACTFHERFGAAVLLNSLNSRWRRNFDLAHELFHLLTWNVFRDGDRAVTEASDKEEKLATCFARNLLIPQEPLRIAIDFQRSEGVKLSFDKLFEVARQFDVSVESLLWQITFVYKLDAEQTKQTVEKLKGQIAYWEKREHDAPPSRPLRFQALANEALCKGLISVGKYSQYVGISRRDAMRQFEQEALGDAEVEITDP